MIPSLKNILKDKTLTGNNYVTWKRKIGFLKQAEKHEFILSTPKPLAHTCESNGTSQKIHLVGKVATVKTRKKVKKQQKKKQFGPTKKVTKIKGKCSLCGENGHWKSNCLKSQNKKKQGNVNYLETCFLADSTDSWIIDSEATNHVSYSLQGFQERKRLNTNEINLRLGNETLVSASAVGDIRVNLDSSRHLDLIDVYYVPQFKRNFISVSCLNKFGYSVTFNKSFIISKNDKIICKGTLENDLFFLHRNISHSLDTELTEPNHKRVKLSKDETYLWHLRQSHINLNRIKRLVSDGPLSDLKVDDLPTCESCLEGKMTKRSFLTKGARATECLGLIHNDLCGPMSIQARGGYECFITFIDDYSRFGYMYLMRHKSDAFDMFKAFKAEVENQFEKHIKILRSDRIYLVSFSNILLIMG
ncbi:hypothetical protein LWI29_018521 [Acer saccharum]|uniref:CCHC-type domain-containing protein n=1 Tax=Acer saccharum TaxID=4024 RepID=A0AA39V9K7_ACESA|nr:hypothetical protein LWI29_018521 [Acer saccharum]